MAMHAAMFGGVLEVRSLLYICEEWQSSRGWEYRVTGPIIFPFAIRVPAEYVSNKNPPMPSKRYLNLSRTLMMNGHYLQSAIVRGNAKVRKT